MAWSRKPLSSHVTKSPLSCPESPEWARRAFRRGRVTARRLFWCCCPWGIQTYPLLSTDERADRPGKTDETAASGLFREAFRSVGPNSHFPAKPHWQVDEEPSSSKEPSLRSLYTCSPETLWSHIEVPVRNGPAAAPRRDADSQVLANPSAP